MHPIDVRQEIGKVSQPKVLYLVNIAILNFGATFFSTVIKQRNEKGKLANYDI